MSLFFKTQTAYLSGSIAVLSFSPISCHSTNLKIFIMQMSLDCSINTVGSIKSESCIGGKHSKVRLTGMAAANAVGEKLPMFVIGKSKKPRCFNEVRSCHSVIDISKKLDEW